MVDGESVGGDFQTNQNRQEGAKRAIESANNMEEQQIHHSNHPIGNDDLSNTFWSEICVCSCC